MRSRGARRRSASARPRHSGRSRACRKKARNMGDVASHLRTTRAAVATFAMYPWNIRRYGTMPQKTSATAASGPHGADSRAVSSPSSRSETDCTASTSANIMRRLGAVAIGLVPSDARRGTANTSCMARSVFINSVSARSISRAMSSRRCIAERPLSSAVTRGREALARTIRAPPIAARIFALTRSAIMSRAAERWRSRSLFSFFWWRRFVASSSLLCASAATPFAPFFGVAPAPFFFALVGDLADPPATSLSSSYEAIDSSSLPFFAPFVPALPFLDFFDSSFALRRSSFRRFRSSRRFLFSSFRFCRSFAIVSRIDRPTATSLSSSYDATDSWSSDSSLELESELLLLLSSLSSSLDESLSARPAKWRARNLRGSDGARRATSAMASLSSGSDCVR
eukprot:Opistho-1_new@83761